MFGAKLFIEKCLFMPVTFDNSNIRRKNPITRNNMFFSKESFDFELDIARDYMEQDMNQTVVLYQIDLEKTKVNDVYKEASKSDIVFKTPVEITCIYEIEDSEQDTYDTSAAKTMYVKPGRLRLRVLEETLKEMGADIKRGDFIGIQITEDLKDMIYFEVNNDGKVQQTANSQTMYGFKPFWRSIVANYVDQTTFNG